MSISQFLFGKTSGDVVFGNPLSGRTYPLGDTAAVWDSTNDVPTCGNFFEKYRDVIYFALLLLFFYLIYTLLKSYKRSQRIRRGNRNNDVIIDDPIEDPDAEPE
jgi:hypothetical protein